MLSKRTVSDVHSFPIIKSIRLTNVGIVTGWLAFGAIESTVHISRYCTTEKGADR